MILQTMGCLLQRCVLGTGSSTGSQFLWDRSQCAVIRFKFEEGKRIKTQSSERIFGQLLLGLGVEARQGF